MIAILQFDGVSLAHFHKFLEEGRLPTFARLYRRGHWLPLDTPARSWEGATYFSLYSGTSLREHGLYYPFIWSAEQQRVRPECDYPAPEPIWDRVGKLGRTSLVIDPYESRQPRFIRGKALCGWQFRHTVTLRPWSVPRELYRQLQRRYGRPSLVQEVYGRPSGQFLGKMRDRLLAAPNRAAQISRELLRDESFDLVWITCSSSHIAGHWFLDPTRLPQDRFDTKTNANVQTTLRDVYAAVDETLFHIVEGLPGDADILILSPSGMGPSASRTHLLPRMLDAVLSGASNGKNSGDSLWRIRAAIPSQLRAWAARVLPDPLTMQLTARLEMRGVDWTTTKAFTLPSGDCGYIRLNLLGREREGIVDPKDRDALLEQIAAGLYSFCDPDGTQAVANIEFVSSSPANGDLRNRFPDLIVHWSESLPPRLAGVRSPTFGDIPSTGWGSGRTGEHREGAWALIVPGRSQVRATTRPPDILDIAATVCSVLGLGGDGLSGQSLLDPAASSDCNEPNDCDFAN